MPDTPAYRFALQLRSAASGPEWTAMAAAADARGWDVVSMPDHLDEQFAPLVGLSMLAPVTGRAHLGTFVLAVGWRHVGMLAKEAATLDFLSGGRLELGLGGGWHAREFAALGLDFGKASARIAVVVEAVEALRALWRGETIDLAGPFFAGTALRCWPPPARPGGPPIVLGGGGPRMLEVAGRLADVVGLIPSNAGRTVSWSLGDGLDRQSARRQVAWIGEAAAGRSSPPLLNIRVIGVAAGSDPLDGARRLAEARGHSTPRALVGSPYLMLGRPEDMAEQMAWARDELGVGYYTLSAGDAPAFAPAMELVRPGH